MKTAFQLLALVLGLTVLGFLGGNLRIEGVIRLPAWASVSASASLGLAVACVTTFRPGYGYYRLAVGR